MGSKIGAAVDTYVRVVYRKEGRRAQSFVALVFRLTDVAYTAYHGNAYRSAGAKKGKLVGRGRGGDVGRMVVGGSGRHVIGKQMFEDRFIGFLGGVVEWGEAFRN